MLHELKFVSEKKAQEKSEPFLTGRHHAHRVKISPREVLYIAIARRGSRVYIHPDQVRNVGAEELIIDDKLVHLYEIWQSYGFAYAHNSYIVNMRYVKSYSRTELELMDGNRLSISRSKKQNFYDTFTKYVKRNH